MIAKGPTMLRIATVLLALPLVACGGETTPPVGGGGPDAPIAMIDAPPGNAVTLPTWRLEDVQPASPRIGQTYGLDTFTGRIIVVSLLEGF